jgi:hypothetical protein
MARVSTLITEPREKWIADRSHRIPSSAISEDLTWSI